MGKKIAQTLRGGDVLALNGQLGAGKTVFIKGLAAGLGIKQVITSPTFVIMKVYKSGIRDKGLGIRDLVHIDCYRVNDPRAIIDIGAADYFGRPDAVTVIEWADYLKTILPKKRINITIKHKGLNQREITIK